MNTKKTATADGASSRPVPFSAPAPEESNGTGNSPAVSAKGYLTAALAYVSFGLALLHEKYKADRNLRLHAYQGLFIAVFTLAAWALLTSAFGLDQVGMLAMWGGMATEIYMAVQAYQGRTVTLPIITPMARRQADNSDHS